MKIYIKKCWQRTHNGKSKKKIYRKNLHMKTSIIVLVVTVRFARTIKQKNNKMNVLGFKKKKNSIIKFDRKCCWQHVEIKKKIARIVED